MKEVRLETPILYFPGHMFLTNKIGSTVRTILDAILIFMNNNNSICFDDETLKKILLIMKTIKKDFVEQTIRNSISELYQNEILLKEKNNKYYVNPIYFLKYSIKQFQMDLVEMLTNMGLYVSIIAKVQKIEEEKAKIDHTDEKSKSS